MDKVLIFGINGFTGRHFQSYFFKNGLLDHYNIVGIDKAVDRGAYVTSHEMDIGTAGSIEQLIPIEHPDYIVNLAGLFGAGSFSEMLEINAEVSRRILATIVENKIDVKKVLLVGSAAEYGIPLSLPVKEDHPLNPVSMYGLSKKIQTTYSEYYSINHGINVSIARTFNILGKGLSSKLSIGSFANQINQIKSEGVLTTGNLNTKRDFLDADDCVDAYWKILHYGKASAVYNVCSGKSMSIRSILDFLIQQSNKKVLIKTDDTLLRKNDIVDFFGDNAKLKADTHWEMRCDLKESIKNMISTSENL